MLLGIVDASNGAWKISNADQGATVQDVSSIFTSRKGARIWRRYENGILTEEPLWLWPMDQRIYDAVTVSGRGPFYVTEVIEQMFGPILAECRSDSN